MEKFEYIANAMGLYKMKTSWLKIEKFYNEIVFVNEGSLSMTFVLLAINNNENGSLVTSIAPRIGMKPNSLSRTLKNLLDKNISLKRNSTEDERKVYICFTELGIKKQQLALEKMNLLENLIKSSSNNNEIKGFFAVIEAISNSIESFSKGK